MNNPKNIEKVRMETAFDEVKKINSKKQIKEFESYVNKVPAFIMTNGIGNTFAYIVGQKGTWIKVIKAIENWLKKDVSGFKDKFEDKNFLDVIIKMKDNEIRALTVEVLAYINWLRKFAKARKIELEKTNSNNNG